MKNVIEIIFPKGKPVAKFNSEGDLVVGTYFAPDDQPHEVFRRGIKETPQGEKVKQTQKEVIEHAQETLGRRHRWLGWGSRSLEVVAGVIIGKTIRDAVNNSGEDVIAETGKLIFKSSLAAGSEVGSVWLRERQRSVDRKATEVERLVKTLPPEPKPRS